MKRNIPLQGLLIENLNALYSAVLQQEEALMKIMEKAHSHALKEYLAEQHKTLAAHLEVLDKVFGLMAIKPKRKKNEVLHEMIKAGLHSAKKANNAENANAGLINTIHSSKHYMIANYSTAVTYANELNKKDIEALLVKNMEEEKEANDALMSLANHKLYLS